MDTNETPSFINYTRQTTPQAQLWIGPHDQLVEKAKTFLQKLFCNEHGKICTTCTKINEQQHHAILWLYPEKQYTTETLEDIFTSISFQLDKDEMFFFIIQKADFLTPLCANKLLKPIEEPPQGYHFIFLAQRLESILPTIRSRCIIHSFDKTNKTTSTHPLLKYFTNASFSPIEWVTAIEHIMVNERESIEILDEILEYWTQYYKNNISTTDEKQARIVHIINVLKDASQQPPMPGSSKLFWRNLYLTLSNIKTV